METLLGLIIGLALGGTGIWLIIRSQIQALNSQKLAGEEKIAIYSSQRDTLDRENREKKQKIDTLESSLSSKEQELRSSLERVSKANAKLEQISDLEAKLETEKSINQNHADNIASHREEISKQATEIRNFEQRIGELRSELQQAASEKNACREEIELANQKSAEATAQKEQLTVLRQELNNKNEKNQDLQSQIEGLKEKLASLETKLEEGQRSAQEKIDLLRNVERNLVDTFQALSANALQNNNQQFIEVAKETFANIHQNSHQQINNLVSPLNNSLEQFRQQINQIENTRQENRGQIVERLENQVGMMSKLQSETANLTKALRQPIVRGRWGELQLKRVVEISGMQEHYDFVLQPTVNTECGNPQRPDMTVLLPGKRTVVIDSKAPLQAYLEAVEAVEESIQNECLKNHARHIRTHIDQLSKKAYWERFEHTPEFVVMFLPGEVFFSAALQQDPRLIEYGIERKIVLATPTTLVSLLKTIEYGWRQEQIADNARKIGILGRDLYDRFNTFSNHFSKIRKKLDDTIKVYNDTVGSYNSRLLVTARRFQEVGGYGDSELIDMEPINRSFRSIAQEQHHDSD